MKPNFLPLAVLLLLTFIAPAPAQDAPAAIDLRPAWQPGQTARYELWSRRERQSTMTVAGESQQAEMVMVTEGEMTWRVDDVAADGSATCTLTLDWMRMAITDDEGGQQTIDSRRDAGDIPPMHQALRAMTGQPLRVNVAADGSIRSVAGHDAIRQQVEIEQLAPDERDYLRSATELAVLVAAPANARPGQTWDTRHAWNHEAGTMHHRATYRLDDVGEIEGIPIATVLIEDRLELEVDDSELPADAPPINVRLTQGDRQAQVLFDLQRREAVGRNSVERTSIEVTVRMPEQTLTQRTDETVQNQALRIAEE
ncbi:MAG: DUF6263 family protein [Phycisphaeraceae bacterium]